MFLGVRDRGTLFTKTVLAAGGIKSIVLGGGALFFKKFFLYPGKVDI